MNKLDLSHKLTIGTFLLFGLWFCIFLVSETIAKNWTAQEWAAWVSAVGTVLAFLGTIYLAHSETRRREGIEYARMTLAVEGMCDDIERGAKACEVTVEKLTDIRRFWNHDASQYKYWIDRLKLIPEWSDEQLLSLVIIDTTLPWRLKRARSFAKAAEGEIEVFSMWLARGGDINRKDDDRIAGKKLAAAAQDFKEIHSKILGAMPVN